MMHGQTNIKFSGVIHEGVLGSGDIFPLVPNLAARLNQYVSEEGHRNSK
jgi:hypothetical protein